VRALAAALLLLASQERGPAGHWTFDDEKAPAADAAGRAAGKLVKGPVSVEGRVGRALRFDGKGAHVEIPNTEALKKIQEGSFTLAAWFKADELPPGTDADNNAYCGIVMKAGNHLGLRFNNDGTFAMDYWLAGDMETQAAATGDKTVEPGKWTHVVGVVDRAAGTTRLFVNGAPDGSAEWSKDLRVFDYGETPWRVGIALPDAEEWSWPAKGLIDDVRIYGRALDEKEVKALFDAAPREK
jgi:hypothetical protein